MGFFNNNNYQNQQSPQNLLLSQYRLARSELIMVLVLTLVNVVSLVINSNFYFFFSLTVPYYSVGYGIALANEFGMSVFLIVGIAAAVLIFGAYAVLFAISKKKPGCLIAALVLFSIDTLAVVIVLISEILNPEYGVSSILDVLVHGLVLFYLIRGVRAASKLKQLGIDVSAPLVPANPAYNMNAGQNAPQGGIYDQNAPQYTSPAEPERSGADDTVYKTEPVYDFDGEGTVRLEGEYNGMKVSAVRKFSKTELAVDGKVYDTYDMIIENGYVLAAEVNGVKFKYSADESGHSTLTADGALLAEGKF